MKKNIFVLIILMLNLYVSAQQKVTKQEVIEIAKNITHNKDVNVYVSTDMLNPATQIKTMWQNYVTPNYESYLIFIDEHPCQSWWHDCKYVFVNTNTGDIETIEMKYPPEMQNFETIKEKKLSSKGKKFQFAKRSKNFTNTENDWAVIISGGHNTDYNYERYWNHCSAIYSALVNVYGYQEDHIFVLMSDGTNPANDRHLISGGYDSSPLDLDGDGDNDIQFAATKANITNVFNTLSNTLNSDDNLFIYTTDHGGSEGGLNVHINLWGESMRDDEFAIEVNKINVQRINMCLVQCFSGGFIDDLQANNRVISTSCDYNESAYAMPNRMYSEFTYHWISAIAGETPEGTIVNANTNDDGLVSMREAFVYARNQDTQAETPQYSSIPSTVGQLMSMTGIIPDITGSDIVCTSGTTYSLDNSPSGSTITWTHSPNLAYVSGQGTANYKVRAANSTVSGAGWVEANINGATFRKDVWVGKPRGTKLTFWHRSVGTNSLAEAFANAIGATNYNWAIGGGSLLSGQGTKEITLRTSKDVCMI